MSSLPMKAGETDPFRPAALAGLRTPGDWLAAAERWYAEGDLALGQVATNGHDEALYLILHALGLPLDTRPEVLDRRLNTAQHQALAAIFRRRVLERVPAAYLTREAWLGEHRFYVDERVIIPRSYFLELIPGRLRELLPPRRQVRQVVDVCTGSGCLAILLAHGFPGAKVDACDLSPAALDVARINVAAHAVSDRVRLHASDVFDAVPPVPYDFILSNPPYEPSAHVDRQAPEFAAEPRLAHDGGRDGLDIIRKLVRQARERLQPDGFLVIEVGGLRNRIDREFAAYRPEWLRTEDGSNCIVLFRASHLQAAR